MKIQIPDTNIYWLLMVYIASNALLLISEGLTYDDAHLVWMLKNELDTLRLVQSQYGNPILYYWEKLFTIFDDPAFYIRLTIFFSNAIGVLYIYKLLKNCGYLNKFESLFITLFYMLSPLYMAKMIINLKN